MNNSDLRKLFIKYIEESGVSQKHVSKKTDIPEDLLSRWKRHGKDLCQNDSKSLEQYLMSNTN